MLDQIVSGAIDVPGETDVYTFEGIAGQSVRLDALYRPTSGIGAAFIGYTLRSPSGSVLMNRVTSDTTVTLPATDTYTLTVDESSQVASDSVASYSFRMVDPANIPPLPDAANLVVTGVTRPSFVIANPAEITVSWTVANIGTAATDVSEWTDRVYVSIDDFAFRLQITGTTVSSTLQFMADTIDADPNSTGRTTLVADPGDLAAALLAGHQIDRVTIDGFDAQVLDAAGHFFHTVTLQPGENTFTVTAFDTGGHSSTEIVTLIGVDSAGPLDFGALDDVTLLAELIYSGTTFNRRTHTLHADVRLTNHHDASLDPPVLAVYERISPAAVELANPNGLHPDTGRPYVNFDGEIPTGGLAPETTSDAIALQFSNAERLRFSVETSLHVRANREPFFTSTPITTAEIDVLYSDTVTADDLDGQALTFELLMAPAGMTLGALNGALAWTPTAAQAGLHDVKYRASDGHGGQVTRLFQIFAGTPQADHAPVFQSEPVSLVATQDVEFRYTPLAIDPEGFAVAYQLDAAPAGAALVAGEVVWTPTSADLGPQTFAVRAADPAGNASFQTFTLDVRGPNTPPEFTSDPVLTATAGGLYRYDADATDTADAVSYSLVNPPAGLEISPLTGIVTWQTPPVTGTHEVIIRGTDERGMFTDQTYTITLTADETPPVVSILVSGNLLIPGETVGVQVLAVDDVAVSTITLTADGVPVALDALGIGSITVTAPGLIAGVTVGATLGSILIPAIGVAYLSVMGRVSPIGVVNELKKGETWISAGAGFLVGVGTSAAMQAAMLKVSRQVAKKITPGVGMIFALYGLYESIKLTWQMTTGDLPAKDAEKYVANLIAGATLSAVVGTVARQWTKRGMENDAEFWEYTPQDQATAELGHMLLPTHVWNKISHLTPLQRGKYLEENFTGGQRFIRGMEGLLEAAAGVPDTPIQWIVTSTYSVRP